MKKEDFLARTPNLALASRLDAGVIAITIVVLALVGAMRQVKIDLPEGVSTAFLPTFYSLINAAVAITLILALISIRRGNVVAHRTAIHIALAGSVLFLACYVIYHFTNEEDRFNGEGTIRVVYLVLLISHVILAAASLPFILHTWVLAATNQFEKHRRLARFVFPVWLYVAVSGPLCYVLLRGFGH